MEVGQFLMFSDDLKFYNKIGVYESIQNRRYYTIRILLLILFLSPFKKKK